MTKAQLAELLRISKPQLEILESPPNLIIPNDIADRLDTLQRALAGQVRKMPTVQCPIHDFALKRIRGSRRLRKEMKMERWWAECEVGGVYEPLYIVRSDGEVQRERGELKLGGRPPKEERERQNFLIGSEVERARREQFERFIDVRRSLPKRIRLRERSLRAELAEKKFSSAEIEAGISAQTATIAARHFIAVQRNLDFRTVGRYHREYIKSVSRKSSLCPATFTKN